VHLDLFTDMKYIIYITLFLVGVLIGHRAADGAAREELEIRLESCPQARKTHITYVAYDGANWKCFNEDLDWPHKAFSSITVVGRD
jgi:hypothetical protein